MNIHLIDTSGLSTNTRESIEMVWGSGTWEPAEMGGHQGEVYRADGRMNVFATTGTVREDLLEATISLANSDGVGNTLYIGSKIEKYYD
jgi:hypothetical protein